MSNPRKTMLMVQFSLVASFTATIAGLIPSATIAGREGNTFMLSIIIPAMIVILIVDGVVISLIYKKTKPVKNINNQK